MSASLVGSEMCIRDRPRRCPRSAAGDARWICALRTATQAQRPCTACLLYTSDAAEICSV
eukprot:589303-Alexandrium_andersonii.AAC.1